MLYLHQNVNHYNPVTRLSKAKNHLDYVDYKFRLNFLPREEICVYQAVINSKEDSVPLITVSIRQLNGEYG